MLKIIIILLLIILIIRMIYENRLLTTTYYTVESEKLPDDFKGARIVLLSDLHNNSFGRNNEELVKVIDDAKPDVIIIVGDMLVGHPRADNEIALNLVKELAKNYPVFYSKGNHEQKLSINPLARDSYIQYEKSLKEAGVKYLVNDSICHNNIMVTGLDISIDFYRKRKRPKMRVSYLEETINKT